MKENSNSEGSKQEIVEWFKCNKCGKFFHYKHMRITNYQEYPGAALSVEYSSPCCNSMDIEQVQDQEATEKQSVLPEAVSDQEHYKCKKCGNIFLLSSDLQVVNYQELCPDTVLPEHFCPSCNTRHVFLRDILARSRDIDQVEPGPSSIRDNITRLVLIKKDKGLLPSTIHPPRRPAATYRSMAGLQPAHPEVVG